MSLADKFDETDASCLHVSTCPVELIHMAKPVTEMERSEIEVQGEGEASDRCLDT